MYYILHHPKGTLMLSAQDREQVLQWSQRQLGTHARLVSVSEKDFSETGGFVEKGGTGITAREADGCQPVLSIMANYVQYVCDAEKDHMDSDTCVKGPQMTGRMPTLH
jgi:hypothetical protein